MNKTTQSGTALWTEEVTGRSYVRKLWKAMRKRLVEHADQMCLDWCDQANDDDSA